MILGAGGPRHLTVVRILVDARARVDLAVGQGMRPLAHAHAPGYTEMMRVLESVPRS